VAPAAILKRHTAAAAAVLPPPSRERSQMTAERRAELRVTPAAGGGPSTGAKIHYSSFEAVSGARSSARPASCRQHRALPPHRRCSFCLRQAAG